MIKILLLISMLTFLLNASAQDQTINGSLTVKNDFITGNNSSGTTSNFIIRGPNNPFGIESKRDIAFEYNTAGKSIIRTYRGESFGNYMQLLTTDDDNGYTPKVRLHIHNNGNIGIGTTSPKYLFHINGNLYARDAIFGNNISGTTSNFIIQGPNNAFGIEGKRDIAFEYVSAGKSIIRTYRSSGYGNYMQFLTTDNSSSTPKVRLHIHFNGNIGIGTETPQSALDIKGKVVAEEVEIKVASGADFVFESDYLLKPLSDVESFIKENKHLPEIPSEKEMIENGLNVNEMQIKLLQKIEELTLYVIEQDKKINKLEKLLEDQNSK